MRRNNGDNANPDLEGDGSNIPGYTDGTPDTFDPTLQVNNNGSEVNARQMNDTQEAIKRACEEGNGAQGPSPGDPTDDRFELVRAVNSAANVITRTGSFVASGLNYSSNPGSLSISQSEGFFVQEGRKVWAQTSKLGATSVFVDAVNAGNGTEFSVPASRDCYVHIGYNHGANAEDGLVITVLTVPNNDPPPAVPAQTFLICVIVTDATEVVAGGFQYVARTPESSSDGEAAGDGFIGIGSAPFSGLRGRVGTLGNTNQAGVVGEGGGISGAPGVLGQGRESDGPGLRGEGDGVGAGVEGIGIDGYGGVFESDTTTPQRGAIRLVPQDSDPGISDNGAIYVNDGINEIRTVGSAANWRTVVTRENGYVDAQQVEQAATNNSAVAYTTIATVTLAGDNSPQRGGVLYIDFGGEFGPNAADLTNNYDLRIRDITAAVDVWQRVVIHSAPVAATVDRPFSNLVIYTLPAIGDRTFEFQMRKTGGGGNGIDVIDGWLRVRGLY